MRNESLWNEQTLKWERMKQLEQRAREKFIERECEQNVNRMKVAQIWDNMKKKRMNEEHVEHNNEEKERRQKNIQREILGKIEK